MDSVTISKVTGFATAVLDKVIQLVSKHGIHAENFKDKNGCDCRVYTLGQSKNLDKLFILSSKQKIEEEGIVLLKRSRLGEAEFKYDHHGYKFAFVSKTRNGYQIRFRKSADASIDVSLDDVEIEELKKYDF